MQAIEMSAGLSRRGHRVFIALPPGSRLEEAASGRSLTTVPVDVSGYFHPLALRTLARIVRRHAVDIVHCQLSKDLATVVPAVFVSGARCPIILSKRVGSYLSKRDPLHRLTYSRVSRVLAISDIIRKNVLDTTPMRPDKVLVLHDAIDTSRFSPDAAEAERVRAAFGYQRHHTVIGFVGRFSPGKGHEEMLQAVQRLRSSHPDMRVLFVGEASYGEREYEQSIHALCTSYGLDDIVTFAGYRSDIPDVMASFDVFAFPSHAEAFGVALIEAMAMERPVVSTNCDGVLDIVRDGETGIFVSPKNPDELAAGLDRLMRDGSLRISMGIAGRKRVMALFDQEKQINRLEEIYAGVLHRSPMRNPSASSARTRPS